MLPKDKIPNAKKAMDAAEKWLDVPQVRGGEGWREVRGRGVEGGEGKRGGGR